MVDTLKNQLFLFFVCFLFGIFLSVFFDITRASRRIYKTGFAVTFAEDFLFFLFCSVMFFALCLKFNNGEIRAFMIFSTAAGSFLYFNTISFAVVPAIVFLVNFFHRILKIVFEVLIYPLRLIVRILNRPVFFVFGFGKRGIRRFVSYFKVRLLILKKFGFLKFGEKNKKI